MSTVITIDGIDRTDKFNLFSLEIVNNKRTYNKLRGTLHSEEFTLEEGVDIQVTIDGNLEFGGLLQNVRNMPTTVLNKYSIYATGYEQITDRRTIGFTYTDEYAGDIVNELVNLYLADENITLGNIHLGERITWSKNAASIRDVLDEISLTSGYVWFIDNQKRLFFQPDYNYTSESFPNDYEVLEVGRSLTGYANKVFVIGAGGVVASANDATEQLKMKDRYGTGVYGVIVRDSKADTVAKAQEIAQSEINKRSFDKKYVKIKTRSRLFPGANYSNITIPFTDVGAENYAIDEVIIQCIGNTYTYTATLEPFVTQRLSVNKAWEERMREFVNGTNTEIVGDAGSDVIVSQVENDTVQNGSSLVLDGLTVGMLPDTVVAFDIMVDATSSAVMNAELSIRIDGNIQYTTSKRYYAAALDQIVFHGSLPKQEAGTYLIDCLLEASTGTLSIDSNKYIMTLTVYGGTAEEGAPYPTANIVESWSVTGTVNNILAGWSDEVQTEIDTPITSSITENWAVSTLANNVLSTWTDTVQTEVI